MEQHTARTSDGWSLGLTRRPALGPCRGTVLVLPAMMVDARTLDRPPGAGFATCLVEHGFEVWTADFRGHGASRPGVAEGASWTYDDLVYHDVPALLQAVAEHDPAPLWVVGHSLGAHVVAAALAVGASRVLPHGCVMIAGNVWLPSLEGSARRRLRKSLSMRAFRGLARAFGYWPSRRLRMGPVDEALPYIEDLNRFWREDAWRSRDGQDFLANLPSVEGPVLCVTGSGDRLFGHVEGVRAFTERFGPGRVHFEHVGVGDHGLSWDPDHMGLLTDARSRPLWDWIATWMHAHHP